ESFYSIADLTVVGGSFIPHGGHNVLEPASLSKAVLFGPHTENFADEVALLLEAEAAILAADAEELEKALGELLEDGQERSRLGEKAGSAFCGLSGSIERHIQWIDRALTLPMPGTN
ncbi:MAG: 3-deoxy-D-manno-octulosonic acid transferase, partial [Planctomycetota bacterium]|nr:3-deoxy-D-manno-octulosonic acid transferase [Planctomycetota bacterium]